jgi:CHAT domain-containing protein
MRLIFFFAFALVAEFSVAQTKGENLFEDAKAALDEGQTEKALKLIQSARDEFLKAKNFDRYFVTTQSAVIIYQDTDRAAEAVKVIRKAFANIPLSPAANTELHAKLYDNLAYGYLYLIGDLQQALQSYNRCIALYTRAGKTEAPDMAFELVNRAVVFYDLARFDSAIIDLRRAAMIYETDDKAEKRTIAEVYQQLGANYREATQYNNGITAYEKAVSLVKGTEDLDFAAALQNDLGITLLSKGDVMNAMPYLENAKNINKELHGEDADHYCKNLINIGNAFKEMGDYENAMIQYNDVVKIYGARPPTNLTDKIDLLVNLSQLKMAMGLTEAASENLREARLLAVSTYGESSVVVADVLVSAAAMAFGQAKFDESLNLNFAALEILEREKFSGLDFYAMIYNNVGQAYDELFEIELALKYKTQARQAYENIFGANSTSVAMAIGNIGLTYEMAGNYDEALKHLKQALEMRIRTQGKDHEDVGTVHLNIGLVYLKKLQPREALVSLNTANEIYGSRSKHRMKAMILNRMAAAEALLRQDDAAIGHFQAAVVANTFSFNENDPKSFPSDPDFIDYYELLISCIGKAEWFLRSNDPGKLQLAATHLGIADHILKAKAIKLNNPKDRLELAQVNAFFTEAGMKLAATGFNHTKDVAFLERAFYFSERNKSNELYTDIRTGQVLEMTRMPRKKLRDLDDFTTKTNTLEQQIAAAYQAGNQALITNLKSQQYTLSKAYEVLKKEIGMPAFAADRSLPAWVDIKKVLDPTTALVMYTITDSSRYVMVGTTGGLALRELTTASDLEKMVRGFRNYVITRNADVTTIAQQLHDIVWSPVAEILSKNPEIKNVIIIPDGVLSSIPFEALANTDYLGNKYNIRYHLSAAMMMTTTAPTPKRPSLVAMAPVFDDKATNYVNKSCERFVNGTKRNDSNDRSFSLDGEYIMPLPGTETEVQQIHKLHQEKDLFSKFFLKEGAHEELIKKGELASYDYIHFATHGIVNSQYPELSGLLLTQDARSSEDGLLYTGEIMGLQLKANLVTLSACETALGKRIEGEGVRGLTSAFLMAGAQTVVVSLWKVADESTAIFMVEFYNQLLSGKDKSTSLTLARQKLMKDEKFNHPFYWAPFVQVGAN